MSRIYLDARYLWAATRHKFKGDASCSRKKIEGSGFFPFDPIVQDIE
jgi:hypothetical protein